MKELIINEKIEKCRDCAYCNSDYIYGDYCFHPSVIEQVSQIPNNIKIPDFCPLPEYHEHKNQ